MTAFQKLVLTLTAFVLLVGCRHAPVTYQLVRQGSTAILMPPTRTASDTASAYEVKIKDARAAELSRTGCDIEGPILTLHWDGNTARVGLTVTTYYTQPESEASRGGVPQPGMYLGSLQNLAEARSDVLNLETKGCLTPIEDQRMLRAVVEQFPLPTYVAYVFRLGTYGISGGLDLNSDFRLQVISPVYSSNTPSAQGAAATTNPSNKPTGYETAYYVFTPSGKDDRVKISRASVAEADQGETTALKNSEAQNGVSFPEAPGYFRLLFRTALSSADHVATIISATDKASLEEAVKQRESGPVESCQGVSAPGANCITFSSDFGVNAEIRVRVNGHEAFVGVEGTVRDAMDLRGPNPIVPTTLTVRRKFQGHLVPVKFDPATHDILGLVLMPEDEINW